MNEKSVVVLPALIIGWLVIAAAIESELPRRCKRPAADFPPPARTGSSHD